MEHLNNENIMDALKVLDLAAKQRKDELRSVISDKYTHLRSLINEGDNSLMTPWSTARDHAIQAATRAKDAGIETVRGIAGSVDRSVHTSPWLYIASTASAGLLLGYLLGRNRQAPSNIHF